MHHIRQSMIKDLEKRKDKAMNRSDTDDFWIKIESLQWVLFVIIAIKNGNMVVIQVCANLYLLPLPRFSSNEENKMTEEKYQLIKSNDIFNSAISFSITSLPLSSRVYFNSLLHASISADIISFLSRQRL
jgi:hypothetical protein